VSADARLEQACTYLAGHTQPVDHLPPSQLMDQLAETRRHLAAVLTATGAGIDSESWTCTGAAPR
jgi:hypothetical protein